MLRRKKEDLCVIKLSLYMYCTYGGGCGPHPSYFNFFFECTYTYIDI